MILKRFFVILLIFVFCLIVAADFSFSQEETGRDAAFSADIVTDIKPKDADPNKISLDLKGVDILELLKILAVKLQLNIVPTKEVTGRVNVYLNNVKLEDALEIILVSNGLAASKKGDVVTVMPAEKYSQFFGTQYSEPRKVRILQLKHAAPKDAFAALGELKSSVGKIITDESSGTVILMDVPESLDLMERAFKAIERPKDVEIFNLKYAKAEDIQQQLANLSTPGTGEIELDSRTNKVMVTDLPDKMKKIKKVIEAFDSETREVLIEAQIVQIALNDKTQYGIDWERLATTGQLKDINFQGHYPQSGLTNNLSVGTLDSNDFNVVVQALNTYAKTNILSRPRIAVVNGQEATILIGSKEVVVSSTTTSTANAGSTVSESISYIDVGVKLNVTPTITDDDFVIIKIRPEVSSVRETVTTSAGTRVPVVETSQAESVVKVKDKAMIMIAGLMKDESRYSSSGFPFLGKLPILSWIFSNKEKEMKKTELAIFLTPRIITGDVVRINSEKEQVKSRGVVTKRLKGRLEGVVLP